MKVNDRTIDQLSNCFVVSLRSSHLRVGLEICWTLVRSKPHLHGLSVTTKHLSCLAAHLLIAASTLLYLSWSGKGFHLHPDPWSSKTPRHQLYIPVTRNPLNGHIFTVFLLVPFLFWSLKYKLTSTKVYALTGRSAHMLVLDRWIRNFLRNYFLF